MSEPDNNPPLLAIPLELREKIYKEVFSDASQGSDILRTCREIYVEAYKYLFQRPLLFRSQSDLYEWLPQVPSEFLKYVTDITLSLLDVDLKPLLDSTRGAASARSKTRGFARGSFTKQTLKQLQNTLASLPNVKSLTLRTLANRFKLIFIVSMSGISWGICQILWPDLQGLTLDGNFHYQDLFFLKNLSKLKSFFFRWLFFVLIF